MADTIPSRRCRSCGGSGFSTTPCPNCDGRGHHKVRCPECLGEGCAACQDKGSRVSCAGCQGTAMQECSSCNGVGREGGVV